MGRHNGQHRVYSRQKRKSGECFPDSPSTISSQPLEGYADPDADVDYHQSQQTSLTQAMAAVTLNSALIASSETSSSKSTVAVNPILGLTTGSFRFTIYLRRGRITNSSPGDETSESMDTEDNQHPGLAELRTLAQETRLPNQGTYKMINSHDSLPLQNPLQNFLDDG